MKEVGGPENKSCGITGITWMADREKWRVRLSSMRQGKLIRKVIGDFSDLDKAKEELIRAKKKFKEPAKKIIDSEWIFLD